MSDTTIAESEPSIDVCLSFAGEDRQYVERVAAALKAANVSLFYDRYEEVSLWGKDLYQHLDEVYRTKARYCVIFISAAYAKKLWTKHELKSAQARAFRENREYILPVRFDDTELPGVLPTTGYVNLKSKTPEQLADLIMGKVGVRAETIEPARVAAPSSIDSILYCQRCGVVAGDQSVCTGTYTHHSFQKGTGKYYCDRCGIRAGKQSVCTGTYTHHNFVLGSKQVYCGRCGVMAGTQSVCTGTYTHHIFDRAWMEKKARVRLILNLQPNNIP